MPRRSSVIVPRNLVLGSVTVSQQQTSGNSLTFTHTLEASNLIGVMVFFNYIRLNADITVATFGGQALTLLDSNLLSLAGNDAELRWYYLANPPTGAQTVTFTRAGSFDSSNVGRAVVIGVSNGTNPVNSTFTEAQTSGSSASLSVTPDDNRGLLVDWVVTDGLTNHIVPATQVQLANYQINGSADLEHSISFKFPNSNTPTTMTRSWTGSVNYAAIAAPVTPF